MSVRWADPELQAKKKKALEDANADNRMVRRACRAGGSRGPAARLLLLLRRALPCPALRVELCQRRLATHPAPCPTLAGVPRPTARRAPLRSLSAPPLTFQPCPAALRPT